MRITITDLRALDENTLVAVYVQIISESGEREDRVYHILPEQYAALRLRVGVTSFETVDAIEEAATLCGAIRRGLCLLSYGSQSEKALQQKLIRRGIPRELAAAATAYLREQGLMNEGEDARLRVAACRRKLWGPRRILTHLFEKGYPEATVRRIGEELAEENFTADCMTLIRKKYPDLPQSREERQKMTGALLRYGYEMRHIRAAVTAILQEDGETS